jgi:branched-chain amino acid transport system ATP-binding protein
VSAPRRHDPTDDPVLRIDGLVVRYGAVMALRGLDFTVKASEIVAVVGPNGAGKSTLLSAIAGALRPQSGQILFRGQPVAGATEDVARRGIALVPEGRHVFARMTVLENLRLGATTRRDSGVGRDLDGFFQRFPVLARRRNQLAGQLSGGEQQQLVICRALLGRPSLLLLDEPSLGLAPLVIDEVYRLITSIREGGTTVVVVEQSAARALATADRTFVLNGGTFRLNGTGAELARHPDFEAAYFGLPQHGAGAVS